MTGHGRLADDDMGSRVFYDDELRTNRESQNSGKHVMLSKSGFRRVFTMTTVPAGRNNDRGIRVYIRQERDAKMSPNHVPLMRGNTGGSRGSSVMMTIMSCECT